MKYYFTALKSGATKSTEKRYLDIIDFMSRHGHSNTNFFHMKEDNPERQMMIDKLEQSRLTTFEFQLKAMLESDALVCDITSHSATVGYQVLQAINDKIPCLALYFKDGTAKQHGPSEIFKQSHNGLLKLAYLNSIDDLEDALLDFQNEFINKPIKFNFYIPLDLHNSLAKKASETGVTKSELVRRIITEHLNSEKVI
jgi:hypothetical protein